MKLKAGDWVEVKSQEEILRSLDKNGRLEGMPLMPQMLKYCGKQFRVFKRAHKTCDWIYKTRGRRIENTVHLEIRCDGEAYGGCQASCLIFWKDKWLKPINKNREVKNYLLKGNIEPKKQENTTKNCTIEDVFSGTRVQDGNNPNEFIYTCQVTDILKYSTFLPWWDVRQYVEDYLSGNNTLWRMVKGFIYAGFYNLANIQVRWRTPLKNPMIWLYDKFQSVAGGVPYPRRSGTIPSNEKTPNANLNLKANDYVKIKTYNEILSTLNQQNRNRGLYFDAEQVPYCGRIYKVRTRVEKYIDEKTGKLTQLKNPAVILDDTFCRSRYSDCRMFCPRSNFPWWREIWLERVENIKE